MVAITTKGIIIISSSNSRIMEIIRMLISKDKGSNIITIFMVVGINTTIKTTKDNGRTTDSNSNSITIISSKWINHHLFLTKTSTIHFTHRTNSIPQCTTKSKTSRHFTLSQTPMLIAFIHDKFTTVTSNKIISRLLPAMDKCRIMVSIFQALSEKDTLVVVQGRSSWSSFQMVMMV